MEQKPHRIISQTMIDSNLYSTINKAADIYENLCKLRESSTTSEAFNAENQALLSQAFISRLRNTVLTLQSVQADVEIRFFTHTDLNELADMASKSNLSSTDYLALEYHENEIDTALKTIKTAEMGLNKLHQSSPSTPKI